MIAHRDILCEQKSGKTIPHLVENTSLVPGRKFWLEFLKLELQFANIFLVDEWVFIVYDENFAFHDVGLELFLSWTPPWRHVNFLHLFGGPLPVADSGFSIWGGVRLTVRECRTKVVFTLWMPKSWLLAFSFPLYKTIDPFYIKNLILKMSNMYRMYNRLKWVEGFLCMSQMGEGRVPGTPPSGSATAYIKFVPRQFRNQELLTFHSHVYVRKIFCNIVNLAVS